MQAAKYVYAASNTIVNGKSVETAIASKAVNACDPPTISNVAATRPSKTCRNTHCKTGASVFPQAVIMARTSKPESEELTKKHQDENNSQDRCNRFKR